ncbi:MAG TPA: 3-deoxy-8-phosphooctulonate synthase [Armatimonadota bacterium]|nr:3-deoxy-8-phosphooctulonate synthase [Armatimonadota bacterium]HUX05940.1 3-deoxy-8-phosphooctulonate synthase [Acidobacteriota bacterium]
MAVESFEIASGIRVGGGEPLLLIAGPCVIESRELALSAADQIAEIVKQIGIPWVYKSSYDKANRTSVDSFRGPGPEEGLRILSDVKNQFGVPILTDIHTPGQAAEAAEVADVVQIPAFLCRQTDLLTAAGRTGRTVNVKKGQFLSPWEVPNIVAKLRSAGCDRIMVTERGSSFGYNHLVVDMKSLPIIRDSGVPAVFDATHSVQLPGGEGDRSGGLRRFIPTLAHAAVAAGADALFLEVHPDPDKALCDGPNMWPISQLHSFLEGVLSISKISGKWR